MRKKVIIAKLKRLQTEADAIRGKLGINAPNTVLYFASLDACSDEQVVVEADGFGGATTSTVEGNYPLDYLTHHAKEFRSEEAAIRAAAEIVEQQVEPASILA
jgi:hypothetical protein